LRATHGPALAACRTVPENRTDRPVSLRAVCDLDGKRAADYGTFGFERSYTDYDAMVRSEDLDGIVAVTPVARTRDIAGDLLAFGPPVPVENPPGRDPRETRPCSPRPRNTAPTRWCRSTGGSTRSCASRPTGTPGRSCSSTRWCSRRPSRPTPTLPGATRPRGCPELVTCETLPPGPDLRVDGDGRVLTEPVEVGPFRTGIVFVHVSPDGDEADVTAGVDVGISPTGYDDWATHWVIRERIEVGSGMHAVPLDWFGNWLRLAVDAPDGAVTVRAWFVGKE